MDFLRYIVINFALRPRVHYLGGFTQNMALVRPPWKTGFSFTHCILSLALKSVVQSSEDFAGDPNCFLVLLYLELTSTEVEKIVLKEHDLGKIGFLFAFSSSNLVWFVLI